MSIAFYEAPMSSASPVAWALAELGVAHQSVKVDLAAKDQKRPEFLKLNPNGKVPTIVVDGTPMFEALAIMLWLGDKYGPEKKLWPAIDAPARLQALAWSTWAYVTLGPAIGRLSMASSPRMSKELHNAAQAEYARRELADLLSILDARMAEQPYMLGAPFSLVDVIDASVVGYGSMVGVDVAAHRHVSGWVARCQARPSFGAVR
jgi:glutathione S-transferase